MASEHDLHTSETEFVRVCSTTAKHDKRAVACGCLSMLSLLATAVLSVFLLLGFEGAVAPALICLAFSLCFLLLTS